MTPADRVSAACEKWGEAEVVRRCARLLRLGPDEVATGPDGELAAALGGLTDPGWFAGGKPPGHAYWARVWAARALRYVWHDDASGAVIGALDDGQWRVREMAARVAGDRELGAAADALVDLLTDRVPRVVRAALEALAVVGEGEHADALREVAGVADPIVARAAQRALEQLARRLDRPV